MSLNNKKPLNKSASFDKGHPRLSRSNSNSKRYNTNISKGVSIINSIVDKYEEKSKGLKSLNASNFIPISMGDSNTIFEEIDIDNGGSCTIDEIFYYVVDKMVGLPYNYRAQINKTLRKVFKICDSDNDNEISKPEFNQMMQFIITWFRIYQKFKNHEGAGKNWSTDERDMKDSGLHKFVDGNNFKDRIINLTYGRREDLATFQDYINYVTEFIARIINDLKPEEAPEPEPVKNSNKELIEKLNRAAAKLQEKIDFLECEKKLLNNDKDMYGEFGNEAQSLEENVRGLEAEKATLLRQQEDLKQKWDMKLQELDGNNMDLMEEKEKVLSEFSEYKNEEEGKLQNYVRDMNAKLDRLGEDIGRQQAQNAKRAAKIEEMQANLANLQALKADLEHDNVQIKKSNDVLNQEVDRFNQGFHADMDNLGNTYANSQAVLEGLKADYRAEESMNSKLQDDIKYYESLGKLFAAQVEEEENGLEAMKAHNHKLHGELSKAKAELRAAHDEQKSIKDNQMVLNENLAMAKAQSKSLSSQLIDYQSQIDNDTNELLISKNKLDNLKRQVKNEQESNNAAKQSCQEANDLFTSAQREQAKQQSELQTLLDNQYKKVQEYHGLLALIAQLQVSEGTDLLDEYPPRLDKAQADINVLLKALKTCADDYRVALDYPKSKEWTRHLHTLSNLSKEAQELIQNNAGLYNSYSNTNSALHSMQADQYDRNRLSNINQHMRNNIKTLDSRTSPLEHQNKDYKHTIMQLEDQINQLRAQKIDPQELAQINRKQELETNEIRNLNNKTNDLNRKIKELTERRDQLKELLVQNDKLKFEQEKKERQAREREEKAQRNQERKENSADDKPKKKKARKDDIVHNMVTQFMEQNNLKIPFEYTAEGKYKYGTKVVNVKVFAEHAMVRIGGGWINLKEFCAKYEADELRKINFVYNEIEAKVNSRPSTPKGKTMLLSTSNSAKNLSTNITSSLKSKVGSKLNSPKSKF